MIVLYTVACYWGRAVMLIFYLNRKSGDLTMFNTLLAVALYSEAWSRSEQMRICQVTGSSITVTADLSISKRTNVSNLAVDGLQQHKVTSGPTSISQKLKAGVARGTFSSKLDSWRLVKCTLGISEFLQMHTNERDRILCKIHQSMYQ